MILQNPTDKPQPKNKTMRLTLTALIGITALTCTYNAPAAEAKPAKIKVLLVTGDDVGPHPWREMSEATREVLVAGGRFDVKVCEDPLILESAPALKNYDLIFLSYYNAKSPTLSDTAKENLVAFVKGGKAWVGSSPVPRRSECRTASTP